VGTTFKPSLGELYKSTQFAPKFAYLRSKIEIFFWGGGTLRRGLGQRGWGTTPSPDPSFSKERTPCIVSK